ncbi:MAG: right-handed parallel beta-helix repeat-containing protein [Acidobacteria bacterium]|nr:right-handed parallel beta-helix repeat-containing protein [Acidobacteriota bacterium]
MKPAILCACLLVPILVSAASYGVRSYGAKGDGKSKDTAAIQAAIDSAAKAGGGVVLLPAGTYLSGTLHLRSDITIELSAGATLAASRDRADFAAYETLPFKPVDDEETAYFRYALLAGENLRRVSIRGPGTVDGNRDKRGGPKPLAFKNCERVSIRGLTIRDAPNYAISLLGSSDVDIDGVSILNGYSDGIDPDCSRFVRISNCYIDSADDAVCLKTSQALGRPQPTEHVTVTNCVLRTNQNHFKLGTESRGAFRNIALSNCTMLERDAGRPSRSGITISSVDGAGIDGVAISNVVMRHGGAPFFLRLGNRGRGLNPPAPGSLRNVSLSNIVAEGGAIASSIAGLEGHPVRNISLADLNLTMSGGGAATGGEVPEAAGQYPQAAMFGPLPAYGLYARHVEGLSVRNLAVRWVRPDPRPALAFDDVASFDLSGFRFDSAAGPQPVLWFHHAMGGLVSGCRVGREIPLFLRVTGARSKDIGIAGNDLRLALRMVDLTAGANYAAAALSGNLVRGRLSPID